MTDKVGIFRQGDLLESAVEELQQLLVRSRSIGIATRRPGANPGAGHRLPGAEDAETRPSAWPMAPSSAPRAAAPITAKTTPAQRRRLAQAHPGQLARPRQTLPTLATSPSTSPRMELPPAGAATAPGRHRAPGHRAVPPRSPPSAQPSATPTAIPCNRP